MTISQDQHEQWFETQSALDKAAFHTYATASELDQIASLHLSESRNQPTLAELLSYYAKITTKE